MRTITINQQINYDELVALAVAVKMLDAADVEVPTREQLSDIALIVSGLSSLDFHETERFLESMISFEMEEGVRI